MSETLTVTKDAFSVAASYHRRIIAMLASEPTKSGWERIRALVLSDSNTAIICVSMRWKELSSEGKGVCFVCPAFSLCQAKGSLYEQANEAAKAMNRKGLVSILTKLADALDALAVKDASAVFDATKG